MSTKKEKTHATFFKFDKVGKSVKGTFKGFYTSEYGLNIQLDNNLIGLNTSVLKSRIGQIKDNLINGKSKIEIKFVSEEKKKGRKQPLKIYDVFLNGVKIESVGTLKEANEKDISNFFNS